MFTLASLMILIGIEIFAVAISGAWALAGLFELGHLISYVLMGVFSLGAVYMLVQLWRRAASVEAG